jgi:hypothetical protein
VPIDLASLALDQTGDGGPFTCVVVISVVGLILIILLAMYAYQKYVASKRPVQHLCDYCGHMVNVVSDCHHAPVKEKFLHGICQDCKKECRLVCARCKRPV